METNRNEIQEKDGSIFLIESKIGTGGQANAYLVKRENSTDECVAKVQINDNDDLDSYNKELKYLNILSQYHSPRIIKLISSGIGKVNFDNNTEEEKKYLILEYAKGGNLSDYIFIPKEGLGELKSKLIFYKILEGIKVCHEHGICHLDIKLENIFLDNEYSPKIGDFGCSTENSSELEITFATREYLAPEAFLYKPVDGFKADIFSLGASLMQLTFGVNGFDSAEKSDYFYLKIICENYEEYWELFSNEFNNISPEFKELYMYMVTYDPKERPTIEEILNHKWFDEIKAMDQKQKEELENEIKDELNKRKNKIEDYKKLQEFEVTEQENDDYTGDSNRDITDSENIYFEEDLNPEEIKYIIKNNNYIKLKGNINPKKFMNKLCNLLDKKYGDLCGIIIDEDDKPKIKVTFEEKEKEKIEFPENVKAKLKKLGIDEEKEKKIQLNELMIQIELFKTSECHLLEFVKKGGNRKEFFEKYKEITQLVKSII